MRTATIALTLVTMAIWLPGTGEAISPEEQEAVFQQLAEKTYHAEKTTDAAGNIIFVCLNQHEFFKKKSDRPDAPGLSDQDMKLLLRLPELRGLTLQRQPISNQGYEVLKEMPQLEVASIADFKTNRQQAPETLPTSEMITYLDGARGLKVLDLTHSFRMQGDPEVLQDMQGFPELEVLVVDVGISDDWEEFWPFVQKSPKLKRLKLHRCNFSEEQIAQLLNALPELEFFEMKPAGNEPEKRWSYQSLKLVAAHPAIRVLRLIHSDAFPLPWENGLEHLAQADNLEVFMYPNPQTGEKELKVAEEDLARLKDARPDLQINPPRPQWPEKPNPAGYEWEIGPR